MVCVLFWFYSAVALLVSWEVSKGLAVFRWQHNMSFYMLWPKRTNSQLCGRLQKNSFRVRPDFSLWIIFDTHHPAAPLGTCIPKETLMTHPCTLFFFGLLPVVMVTPGSEMAFHSGESSPPPHSPAPFLWPEAPLSPAKDPLSTTHCVVQESMQAARLLSLTRLVRCWCLTEASAVPGNVWGISSNVTLLAVQTSFFGTGKKKAWVSDEQQTALCSTSLVKSQLSLRESRWLQQS